MKLARFLIPATLMAVALGGLAGCEDSGGSPPPGGAPDLNGSWSGQYRRPGYTENLSARVVQDGENVVIQTTRAQEGRFFTGFIRSSGSLWVTDGFTGKTWTSAEPATQNRIYLHDYLSLPGPGGDGTLQDIILTR